MDQEQMFVQVNSTFLVAGETLYFKIFCRQLKNTKPTMLSKVAYLEIIDEVGMPVFKTKISLQNGSGHGDLFIPSTFSSGNYTLIAYTLWMKNFTTDSFFTNRITIVNPFKGSVGTQVDGKVSRENNVVHSQSNNIQLELSEKTFSAREKVSITLTGADMANLCISVRKKEAALDDAGTMLRRTAARDSIHSKDLSSSTRAKTYVPEIRGHLVTGTLVPKGEVTATRNILASIPGSNFVFRAVRTDQQGNFAMIVNDIPESATMLFQVLEDDINSYTLNMDDPFFADHSKFRQEPLSIDTSLRVIIDERSLYTQIENAYYEAKRDSLPPVASISFYNLPDKIYKLDDFTRFPTMEDIFREYVPEVNVRRVRGIFSLHIVSPQSGFPYPREPLMLIDGVPMLSTDMLMAYDPLKVESIEIVRAKYAYGSLDMDGIISLKTYKGAIEDLPSFSSHHENVVNVQSGRAYSFPDYSNHARKLERVPDYRLQLYWNPEVSVTKGQPTTVQFYTSDVTGEFEVIVEGFSSDGAVVSTREVFSVLK